MWWRRTTRTRSRRSTRSSTPVEGASWRGVLGEAPRHRAFGERGDGDERVDPDVAGDQRAVGDVQLRIALHPAVVVGGFAQHAAAQRVVGEVVGEDPAGGAEEVVPVDVRVGGV